MLVISETYCSIPQNVHLSKGRNLINADNYVNIFKDSAKGINSGGNE
jgi:hypothetical protein